MQMHWHEVSHLLRSFVLPLGIDLLTTLLIVQRIYLPRHQRRDHAFTYLLLNLITFSVTNLLSSVRVELGFSLGLFAVFGILRYRTEALRIRDLTYLFVLIGLAMLNGVAGGGDGLLRVLLVNGAVVAMVSLLEFGSWSAGEDTLVVRYDRLELLPEHRREALLQDLSSRLGVQCERVIVDQVDLLHDSVSLLVTYRTKDTRTHS